MRIAEALADVATLFLDTAPVVYFLERHPDFAALADPVFDRIDDGGLVAVTSPITLAEALILPVRNGQPDVQRDFYKLVVSGTGVRFGSINAPTAERAAELRVRYNLGLMDAFQVATALEHGCQALLTNDRQLARVGEIEVLVLADYEE